MIRDFTLFTWIHVLISLVPLVAGPVVVRAMLAGREAGAGWTTTFLVSAALTSLTGFGFPFVKFLPSHGVGIVALLILVATVVARYVFAAAGLWRWVWAAGLVITLYLDVFVLVAQFFAKVPALKALAPTGGEPAFAVAQAVVFVAFALLTLVVLRRFRPSSLA